MADTTVSPAGATEALAERILNATIHTLEIASVHLGLRLGFYRALAEAGPASARELAARTGTAERYVREWLEQQAVAGFLSVADADVGAAERRYAVPDAHLPVLVDEDDVNFAAPLATMALGVARPVEWLVAAYRSGGGVPYEVYGADVRDGIAAANRPVFLHQLADWLASVPEIDTRLRAAPPARVADVACGSGWSSIAIARAYPDVFVDAIDSDTASIDAARKNVAAAGLTDRVEAIVADASGADLRARYDLVTVFEALHDMNHPVRALERARDMLAPGGSVLIADERVAERFGAPGDEIERFNYGWSVLHCLAVGMLDDDSAGTGTVMRPDTLREYATAAGFTRVDVLPIDHVFWRFYRLLP